MCGAIEPSTFDKPIVSVLASYFTLASTGSCITASLSRFLYIILALVELIISCVIDHPTSGCRPASLTFCSCMTSASVQYEIDTAWGGFPTHGRRWPPTTGCHTLRHCRCCHHDGGPALRADKADP